MRCFRTCSIVALLGVGLTGVGVSAVTAVNADESSDPPVDAMMHHHHNMSNMVMRTTADYTVPTVQLVREDGRSVSLPQELNDGRPVVMNFIYTTCTTICPLTSQTFAAFQRKLGAEKAHVHLVSVSIDPEQDTPTRLLEYAKKFGAEPGWEHYTGTLAASIAAQRAFDVYRGDKMSHTPVTLIRTAPGKRWLRIDGFVTPDDLLTDFHNQLAAGT